MLFPSTYSTYFVAVLDGGLCLLHACLQFAEAVGDGDTEVTTVLDIDVVTPAKNVTLNGARFTVLILWEGSVGHQSDCQPVIAEE